MPVPSFNLIHNCLPPHLGDPREAGLLGPHWCTVEEVCEHFATSNERRAILRGWLSLRMLLLDKGVTGLQWIGGSFMEFIEEQEGRPPKDIDVVTFAVYPPSPREVQAIRETNDLSHARVKREFLTDHFLLSLGSPGLSVLDESRYWLGLFSHRRDGHWKGMLAVPLVDPSAESRAATIVIGAT